MASNAAKTREWAARFERFQRSAKTVSRFRKDEQISLQAFYYWRERVQANSGDDLHASSRINQSLAMGKASVICPQVTNSQTDGVRLVIRIGAIPIECHAKTDSAINAVLSRASRNQDSCFKQLVAGSYRWSEQISHY